MSKFNWKNLIIILCITLSIVFILLLIKINTIYADGFEENIKIIACYEETLEEKKDFIKWIDFKVDSKSLKAVLKFCQEYRQKGVELDYSQILAYLTIKNSNKFSLSSTEANLKKLRIHLDGGGTIDDIYQDNKYYQRNLESYKAIFDGIVGDFRKGQLEDGEYNIKDDIEYGIKAFFPIAYGFDFTHYDDFGANRSYGYKRRHLGHDFMGQVGTPIVAIEGGVVTELGWNKYGGWRIGIKSFDQKRYYYYAHLRKDKPFIADLSLGDKVLAGQVIGYLGHTGYSDKENTNLKTGSPHLHLGLQIIFDKSQEKGSGEIWIDLYGICNFLIGERAKVIRDNNTKEWMSLSIKT